MLRVIRPETGEEREPFSTLGHMGMRRFGFAGNEMISCTGKTSLFHALYAIESKACLHASRNVRVPWIVYPEIF
jgi:hypothetical protein